MKREDLKVKQTIFFDNEVAGFQIRALNDRFAVCTRELHIDHDSDILQCRVDMNAYTSIEEAYRAMRLYPIYTCIDFEEEIKAAHNIIFNPYDFDTEEGVQELLEDLQTGDTELTQRNRIDLHIDWTRTAKYNK